MENRAICAEPFNYRQRVGGFGLYFKTEGVRTIVTGRLYSYTICDFKRYLEEGKLARLTTLENKLQTHRKISEHLKMTSTSHKKKFINNYRFKYQTNTLNEFIEYWQWEKTQSYDRFNVGQYLDYKTKVRFDKLSFRNQLNKDFFFTTLKKKTDINACFYNLSGPPDHMTRHFFSHRTTTAVSTVYPDIITRNANQFSCLSINRSYSIESSGLSLSAMMTNMPCIWLPRIFYNTLHCSWNVWFYSTLKNINFFCFHLHVAKLAKKRYTKKCPKHF